MKTVISSVCEDGFTLIEILIALSVFAIALLGVGAMQTTAMRGNQQAQVISAEVLQASSKAEALYAHAYSDSDLTAGTHTDGDYSWDVTTVNSGTTNEYKTIALTLTWQFRGAAKTYTINLIKSSAS